MVCVETHGYRSIHLREVGGQWLRVMGLPFCWLNNTFWSYPRFITDNKQASIHIFVDLMCLSILWSDFRESQQNMHVTLFCFKNQFMLNYIHSFLGMLLLSSRGELMHLGECLGQ